MFALKGKQDNFRLLLPDDFLCEDVNEKYGKILQQKKSFYTRPIDFLNETIQSIQVLGISNGTFQQQQQGFNGNDLNEVPFSSTDHTYRSPMNPLSCIDLTLNVNFRHTLGFMNYFMMFENFFWQYARDTKYKDLPDQFKIDILNEKGSVYSKIIISNPLINGIDMLDLNYTQPIAQSQQFKVEFKFSNIDYQFIDFDDTEDI